MGLWTFLLTLIKICWGKGWGQLRSLGLTHTPFVCVYHAHTSRASDISLSYGAQLSPVPVESSSNEILSGDGQLQQDMAVAKLKSQQIPKLKTPEDTPTPEG